MRAFVRLRELLATHADLARRMDELEKKYDKQFAVVFDAIRQLMAPPKDRETRDRLPHADQKEVTDRSHSVAGQMKRPSLPRALPRSPCTGDPPPENWIGWMRLRAVVLQSG